MQEIIEERPDEFGNMNEIRDRLYGFEGQQLMNAFAARKAALDQRLSDGTTTSAEVREVRRIGWDSLCPCGSKMKFKTCCGSRLDAADSRIQSE